MSPKTGYEKPRAEKIEESEIHDKLAELMQLEEEETYRLIVENTHEGIVVAQGDRLRFINERVVEISGYNRAELLSKEFVELVYPDDRATVIENYAKKLKGENTPDTIPFRVLTKDGEIKWVLGSCVKINWQGQPALMGFVIDITSEKR
ncbi:MAG: PAS domain S-box protein, partial [Desulfobacteraceae bacterium]